MKEMRIKNLKVGNNEKSVFIADIGANHDGSLNKAKDLIYSAAENGADIIKFQHFKADTIVSDYGFKKLKNFKTHQSKWKKSVFQTYQDASIDINWTYELKKTCDRAKVIFMTSPYDLDYVDKLDRYLPAYKIGSGDITFKEILIKIAKKKKPCLLATGASDLNDVKRAVKIISQYNKKIILMQCNTNYTADKNNIRFVNLRSIEIFKKFFPGLIIGLSDHTFGHSSVLGAIALGARVFEKHYTLDNSNIGPDHKFAMNPKSWSDMILASRELECALGFKRKIIEKNETKAAVIQRRAIRLARDLKIGFKIKKTDLVSLRPCPKNAISPFKMDKIINRKLKVNKLKGDFLKFSDFN